MPARWPNAATYRAELIALRHYVHQTEKTIGEMLRGNAHWQALLLWITEPHRDELDEEWLRKAREEPLLLQDLATLTNWNAVGDFPAAMIRAAKQVVGIPTPPERDPHLTTWREQCVRSFIDETTPRLLDGVNPLMRVTVALAYERQDEGTLGLAWLELETLPGDGDTVPHPGDVWATIRSDEAQTRRRASEATFAEAMSLAFRAARELSGFSEPARGRWRIVDNEGLPIPIVSGESAGGAAFLGWYRAMTQTVVDPRILVMAAVREPVSPGAPWCLTEVGEIATKVNAILDAGAGIDTIATVGRCVAEAEAAKTKAEAAKATRSDIRVAESKREITPPSAEV